MLEKEQEGDCTDRKSESLRLAERSDLITSNGGALSPDSVAILGRTGADANSTSRECVADSKSCTSNMGRDLKGRRQAGWTVPPSPTNPLVPSKNGQEGTQWL